jgi:hypothetical protein
MPDVGGMRVRSEKHLKSLARRRVDAAAGDRLVAGGEE